MHLTNPPLTAADSVRMRQPLGRLSRRAALALVALSVAFATRWVAAADLPPQTADAVNAAITRLMDKEKVPGLSVAVVTDGQVSVARGFGLADIENNVPVTEETVFRLASISKMLTATAAMQLVEQGKLNLAAPIQKYVPAFPEKPWPITAELLLKHQSGIRHYKGNEVRSVVFYPKVADALAIFKDEPLLFTPGEKFSYTTYGFNLLGCAIEGASGQDYVRYVQEHVSRPAGMKNIQPDNPNKIIPHRAAGYRRGLPGGDSPVLNAFMVDVSNKVPGGGWCATPTDLARFAIALAEGQLVGQETLERMWTRQKTADGKETAAGLGCFVQERDGRRRIYHSGGQPKVSTFLMLDPEARSAVALMCNLENARLEPLAGELLDLVAKPAAAAAGNGRK